VSGETELDTVLTRREVLADGVVRLTLTRPDGGELPAWEAGAHLDLVLAGDLVRQYSLCGDPGERSVLQVAVLREQHGRGGSAHVHDRLAEGATVRIRGPRNHFALVEAERYLFIAGGIGITPLVPMIAEAEVRGADWRLLYGGRTRGSMAFRDALCQAHGDRVTIWPQDERGLLDLDDLLTEADPATAVYCCGPEPLLTAVEAGTRHWPAGALHVERFAPRADADAGERAWIEVELAQTGKTVEVPPGRSILEVVEDAGVPVLSSCREGTCGTCEIPVLDGVPDHRDSLLTERERAEGDTMMICVSRACGDRLVLDL
jgi:ferredoxin-NADP reductase